MKKILWRFILILADLSVIYFLLTSNNGDNNIFRIFIEGKTLYIGDFWIFVILVWFLVKEIPLDIVKLLAEVKNESI